MVTIKMILFRPFGQECSTAYKKYNYPSYLTQLLLDYMKLDHENRFLENYNHFQIVNIEKKYISFTKVKKRTTIFLIFLFFSFKKIICH